MTDSRDNTRATRLVEIGRVALRLGMASAVLGVSAIVILTPTDGSSSRRESLATARSEATSTPRRFTAIRVPRETSAATSAPTTIPTATATTLTAESTPEDQPPADVATGGDQSTAPVRAPYGNIPENVGVSADFMALHNALEQSIIDYNAQVGGIDVALAVTDLQTGGTISVGGNVPHRTGCTINMFALFAAVSDFQAGNTSPDPVADSINAGIGDSYPPEVKNFLQYLFGSYVAGVQRARELMSSWGMTASFYDHVPYYGTLPYTPNILTALETNAVLSKLWRGQLFSPEWTAYTLGRLRNISPDLQYTLPALLPPEATVAHKIGFYPDDDGWVENDAGIVSFTGADGREKAYAITYMSQEANSDSIGTSFGAKLSRDVWDWFADKYQLGSPPSPTPAPTPAETASPTPSSPSPTATSTPSPAPSPTPAASPSPWTQP